MFLRNLGAFTPPTSNDRYLRAARDTGVSVLIPARNEEAGIGAALDSLCESTHPNLEVIVLDDHSEDRTRSVAESFGIKVIASEPLPPGWNGKQFACWQLANQASHPRLLFLDADVRLHPTAIEQLLAHQMQSRVSLLSGFPRQITGSWMEQLMIPMMHYLLLCYLPFDRMRASTSPAFGAGCGQLFLANKKDYFACDGHRAIAQSRHDGLQLPKAFRRHGLTTDIVDATSIASCRMYEDARGVVNGLLKNADEGIANNRLIFVFSTLLTCGVLMPILLFIYGMYKGWGTWAMGILLLLIGISYLPRWIAAHKFQQSWFGAICHPFSVITFLTIQWVAFGMRSLGIRSQWRGRSN